MTPKPHHPHPILPTLLAACLCVLLLTPAYAQGTASPSFTDPMPAGVEALIVALNGNTDHISDCIVFDGSDGAGWCFVVSGGSWLEGYRFADGTWQQWMSGICAMPDGSEVRFRRHDPAAPRADGSHWPDALGFDVVDKNEARVSLHYNGEGFSYAGWHDNRRYAGEALVEGGVLRYVAADGRIECEIPLTANDLLEWTGTFDCLPFTPQEGQARAAIRRGEVETLCDGYTLRVYNAYNDGTMADAAYTRIADGTLYVRNVTLAAGQEPVVCDLMPVPLSAALLGRLETEPFDSLLDVSGYGDLFVTQDGVDLGRVPVEGTVQNSELKTSALVLLTQDAQGTRRLQLVTPDAGGGYTVRTGLPLPADASLDTFHAGPEDIDVQALAQELFAELRLTADGELRLSFFACYDSDRMQYRVRHGVVETWSEDGDDTRLVGTLPGVDALETLDIAALPRTQQALYAAIRRDGWAVVHNPDPADRLHLRTQPERGAASLGKFYSGTPVRVLTQQGDWTRVTVGAGDAQLEGWMMTRYLTFDAAMDEVAPAFPDKRLVEEHENGPAYADAGLTTPVPLDRDWQLAGVTADERTAILLCADGSVRYVPWDWLWDGNG